MKTISPKVHLDVKLVMENLRMHLSLLVLIVPMFADAADFSSEMKCLEKSESVALHGKDTGEITVDTANHRAAITADDGAVVVFFGNLAYRCDDFQKDAKLAVFLKAKIGTDEVALLYFGRNFMRPNHFSDTYPRVEFTTLATISAMASNEKDLLKDADGYKKSFVSLQTKCKVDSGRAPLAKLNSAMRMRLDSLSEGYAKQTHQDSELSRSRVLAALDSCSKVSNLRDLARQKKAQVEAIKP